MKTSKNELAEKIVGIREHPNGVIFDQPCELGYHCPVCKYEQVTEGNFDERLHWGEYNGFLWCSICNKDFPSALCQPDVDKAIETYLTCVLDAKRLPIIEDKEKKVNFATTNVNSLQLQIKKVIEFWVESWNLRDRQAKELESILIDLKHVYENADTEFGINITRRINEAILPKSNKERKT